MATSAEWLQLLRKVFLFSSFTGQQLSLIAKKMTLVSYPKGATLFKANDPGDSLYLILSGTIRILKNDSDGGETLAYLNRGDALGEMALLAGEPRTHTAVVDATADIMVLHKKDFDHLLEKNAAMSLHLSRILSSRLASVHRSGGVMPQPSKVFGLVLAIPPDDQVLFSVNLGLSLVEQTRRKTLLLTVANGPGGPPMARRIGLDAPRVTEAHLRDGVLEDARKLDKFIVVHPSGLELIELDIGVFNERFGETLYPFFSLLKDEYDMCIICLPPRVAAGAAPMLAECDRLLLVAGPQSESADLDELRNVETRLGGKKAEKLWLNASPGTQPTGFQADIRFEWDPAWGPRYAERGTAFFGPDAAGGQRSLDRLARNLGHLVIGFAMGSGAAFGYALIGMLKVLEREGVKPDVIAGTSMGALIGSFYACGKSAAELEEIAVSITRRKLWQMADFIPPRTGLIRGNGILEFLRHHLGDRTFSELLLPFSCVATDILTGKEIVLDRGHVAEAVRASLSLPFFFQPFYHEGRYLVDGGLVNPVPTSIIVSQGANVLLSANLTSKAGERRVPRVIGWWRRHLPSMLKGPSIPETMLKTIYIMQYEIAQSRSELAHVVMQIKAHELLWWDLDRAKEMIKMGEASAEEVMPKIKQLLPFYADSCRIRLVRKGRKSY
jgi:NTE family protein